MKKLKLFMAMLMAIVTIGGMSAVNAANGVVASTTPNSQITLSRSLTNCTQKVTSNTFTYSVEADSTAGNPSGGASNVPTSATVTFTNVNPASNTCTATGTLSLTGATFSKNGDYTYIVKETASSNATSYPVDSTNTYTIKFSVRNASDTDFTSAKNVTILLYTGTGASATKKTDNATFTFTSAMVSRSVTLKNTVEGNMADPDVYFPIVMTITGATAGDSYTISGQSSSSGATTCTVASGATSCTATLMLKHNETATISKLRDGVSIAFSETKTAGTEPAKYTTYWNGSSTASDSLAAFQVTSNQAKTVKNDYRSPVLTGVIVKYLPYILIIALAVAAIIFLIIKNRKNNEEEIKLEEKPENEVNDESESEAEEEPELDSKDEYEPEAEEESESEIEEETDSEKEKKSDSEE